MRGIELIVVEQRLRQGAHGAHVARLNIDGALIGGDGVLGALHLVVCRAQRELHLGGAVGFGNGLDHFGRVLEVAALGIEAGEIQDHFF